VATLALMLLLWGPEKVAELVRLGNRLRREAQRAVNELRALAEDSVKRAALGDEELIRMARSLGLRTMGKTREEIEQELRARAQAKAS